MTVKDLIEKLKKENPDDPIIFDYILPKFFTFSCNFNTPEKEKQEIIKEAFDQCSQIAKDAYTNFREISEVVQETIFQLQEERIED